MQITSTLISRFKILPSGLWDRAEADDPGELERRDPLLDELLQFLLGGPGTSLRVISAAISSPWARIRHPKTAASATAGWV
jgi:hypothetical protein